MVRLVVWGKAEPGGSKKAVTIPGRRYSQIVDANAKAKGWQTTIAKVARVEMMVRERLEGPLGMKVEFVLERPKSVKRPSPSVRPDVLKLTRPLEDALTGIVYEDDGQITYEVLSKRYARDGEKPHAVITVWRLL